MTTTKKVLLANKVRLMYSEKGIFYIPLTRYFSKYSKKRVKGTANNDKGKKGAGRRFAQV